MLSLHFLDKERQTPRESEVGRRSSPYRYQGPLALFEEEVEEKKKEVNEKVNFLSLSRSLNPIRSTAYLEQTRAIPSHKLLLSLSLSLQLLELDLHLAKR